MQLDRSGLRSGELGTWPANAKHAVFSKVPRKFHKPLGPSLYSGTAGFALVLAKLYAVTEKQTLLRTAAGAMRQAFCRPAQQGRHGMIGLFTGALGIVFAGVQVAKLIHHEEIMCRSQEVLARILEGYDGSGGADVISGKAGAILALLILASMLRDRSLESFATRLGTSWCSQQNN
jgi:lantibiotic biosynthesis protein